MDGEREGGLAFPLWLPIVTSTSGPGYSTRPRRRLSLVGKSADLPQGNNSGRKHTHTHTNTSTHTHSGFNSNFLSFSINHKSRSLLCVFSQVKGNKTAWLSEG